MNQAWADKRTSSGELEGGQEGEWGSPREKSSFLLSTMVSKRAETLTISIILVMMIMITAGLGPGSVCGVFRVFRYVILTQVLGAIPIVQTALHLSVSVWAAVLWRSSLDPRQSVWRVVGLPLMCVDRLRKQGVR